MRLFSKSLLNGDSVDKEIIDHSSELDMAEGALEPYNNISKFISPRYRYISEERGTDDKIKNELRTLKEQMDSVLSLEDKIDEIAKNQNALYNKYKKMNSDIDQEVKKQQEITEENNKIKAEQRNSKDDKIRFIEIIGIFISIFTFVSIEINILDKADNFLKLAGLTILMFSGLCSFIMTLFFISERWIRKDGEPKDFNFKLWCVVLIAFVMAGIYLVCLGEDSNEKPDYNKNFILMKKEISITQ